MSETFVLETMRSQRFSQRLFRLGEIYDSVSSHWFIPIHFGSSHFGLKFVCVADGCWRPLIFDVHSTPRAGAASGGIVATNDGS